MLSMVVVVSLLFSTQLSSAQLNSVQLSHSKESREEEKEAEEEEEEMYTRQRMCCCYSMGVWVWVCIYATFLFAICDVSLLLLVDSHSTPPRSCRAVSCRFMWNCTAVFFFFFFFVSFGYNFTLLPRLKKRKEKKETKRNCCNQLGTYSVDDAVINLDCLSIPPLSLAARWAAAAAAAVRYVTVVLSFLVVVVVVAFY